MSLEQLAVQAATRMLDFYNKDDIGTYVAECMNFGLPVNESMIFLDSIARENYISDQTSVDIMDYLVDCYIHFNGDDEFSP